MKDYSEKLVSFAHVSPTFFIGLGGSGSDVVNRISQKLRARWNWDQMSDLVHFFAFDTNTHDLKNQESIPRENRILISDFDKRAYVTQKRGEGHTDEDEFLTQWVHDWYEFRGTRGAGAGQIRIESRLSLYYQLEQDRGRIIQRLTTAANTARHHDNPYRKNNPPHFNVFIYGSIAGGTGSGSFVPMAYLVKDIISKQGWIPKVWGTLIMPSLFLNDVPGALHSDINANGYAALKELEHLMKLGAEGSMEQEAFHYNPNAKHAPHVEDKPYDFVYLADKPTMFEIGAYKNAIADAAYLLLYSPIIGAQASDYDNYEKHQKGLVAGYTVYYGSNGCSVLILPDQDILEYCAMRFAADAMKDYLLFQNVEGGDKHAINFDDPKFQRLSAEAQAAAIDEAFEQFIATMARNEVRDEIENGPYQAVDKLSTPTGSSLMTELEHLIDGFVDEIRDKIDLSTLSAIEINENNTDIETPLNELRRELTEARTSVRSIWDSVKQEIRSGETAKRFFERFDADPYKQRIFLIRAKRRLREILDEKQEDLDLQAKTFDLDADEVRSRVKDASEELQRTVKVTLAERFTGNKDFEHAKQAFADYFNSKLVEGNRHVTLERSRIDYIRELLENFETLLGSFRTVATEAMETIAKVEHEAENARRTGKFAHGDGHSNAFILDVEALDEVGGERLWNLFWEDRFISGGKRFNTFDADRIFAIINDAFMARKDDQGRTYTPTAREITVEIAENLKALGRERLAPEITGVRDGGSDMSQRGLLLEDALFYEARYHFLRQFRADNSDAEPTEDQIQSYIKSKLQFCENKANPLATFGETEDERVVNSRSALVGVHSNYQALEPMLEEVLPYAQRIPKWHDEKSIVFYRANLGIPLFYYSRVNGEMKADYDRVMAKAPAVRGYPIHIDGRWEDTLPSLDPTEAAAGDKIDAKRNRAVDFAVGFVSGVLRTDTEGKVFWFVAGVEGDLGDNHRLAFEALPKLDERTLRRVQGAIDDKRRAIEQKKDANMSTRLAEYLDGLDEWIWKLEQRKDPAQQGLLAFLKEHEGIVKSWMDDTGIPRSS